ncbi:hypothetical protein FACS189431_4180 [Alphaproteobacteria bacterium]|nr:hypothetical protein FACS189431_4180 [Alphaproteobacteria bacterium]
MSSQDFPGQREGEKLLFVFRRHIISMRKGLFALIILSVLGFVPYAIVPTNQTLLWIGLGAVALGLLVLFYHWISWYFSYYIVSNERLRQNRQTGLFKKSVVEVGLDKIQSAVMNTPGLFGSMFGYGTIALHTQVGDLVIDKVSHAEEVYAKLQEAINIADVRAGANDEG